MDKQWRSNSLIGTMESQLLYMEIMTPKSPGREGDEKGVSGLPVERDDKMVA